jgi:beta-lactam-binding protein with PASTA domain
MVLPPQIDMPNLLGFSLQSATTYLKVLGLRVGTITVVPDKNNGVVLDQLLSTNHIEPGLKIPSGTVINLIVGDGSLSVLIEVPNVFGLTVEEAKMLIETAGFKIGNYTSTELIQDTAKAFVIAQNPYPLLSKLDTLTNLAKKNRVPLSTPINLSISLTAPSNNLEDSIK